LKTCSLFHYTDGGDEVVPDGLDVDLIEKKADKTMYVAADQPLGKYLLK